MSMLSLLIYVAMFFIQRLHQITFLLAKLEKAVSPTSTLPRYFYCKCSLTYPLECPKSILLITPNASKDVK